MSQGCCCLPRRQVFSAADKTAHLPLFFSTREKLLPGRSSSAVSLNLESAQAEPLPHSAPKPSQAPAPASSSASLPVSLLLPAPSADPATQIT